MELDCALATGSGLTNVFGLSFIDLAPCTVCVVNASDAAAITIQYAPLALVKVFFILNLPSYFLLAFTSDLFFELQAGTTS